MSDPIKEVDALKAEIAELRDALTNLLEYSTHNTCQRWGAMSMPYRDGPDEERVARALLTGKSEEPT